MKAKVIETGEIINVQCLYPVVYSRLNGGKIVEEYTEDELEFIHTKPKVKLVDIEKVCEWIDDNIWDYIETDYLSDFTLLKDTKFSKMLEDLKKAMEE